MKKYCAAFLAVVLIVTLLAGCGGLGGGSGAPLSSLRTVNVTHLAGPLGGSRNADGTGEEAHFYYPHGLTSDGTNLYVADTYNSTIRKIVIASGVVTTLAGAAGIKDSADGTGEEAHFYYPYGLTSDGTNLYVADTNNHTIRKIVIASGVVTTLAGKVGSLGSADGTETTTRFNHPYGLTSDGTNLYVADTFNNTIRKIVIASGVVTTLAGTAGSLGSADGTGATARFNLPCGITGDGTNLYVTETLNNTIRKIVIASGVVTTLAGAAGIKGSEDGTGAEASFFWPYGITTDGTNLYVADTSNHTIRKIVIASGVVTTLEVRAGSLGPADGTGAEASFLLTLWHNERRDKPRAGCSNHPRGTIKSIR